LNATLSRIGLDKWEFEAHSLEDILPKTSGKITESPDLSKHILKRYEYAELIVIEGLQALMPDVARGRSQNKQELLWALEQRLVLTPQNKTIIATTHNPKIAQQGVQDDRSKFLGSQGFIGSCSTMIGFEKDEKIEKQRRVKVLGRNFPDIKLIYSLDECGRFVLEGSQDEQGTELHETDEGNGNQIITVAKSLGEFSAAEIGKRLNTVPRASLYRCLDKFVAINWLEKVQDGRNVRFRYVVTEQ
jgi:hypothetical protein